MVGERVIKYLESACPLFAIDPLRLRASLATKAIVKIKPECRVRWTQSQTHSGISIALKIIKLKFHDGGNMKIAPVLLSSFLLVAILSVGGCDQTSDQQGGKGSAPQKEGAGAPPSRDASK